MIEEIAITIASLHFDGRGVNRDHYHQFNPGAVAVADLGGPRVLVGAYRNSFGRPTILAGRQFEVAGRAGLMVAANHGYSFPVVGAATWRGDNWMATFTPKVGGQGSNVLGFLLRLK